MSAGGFLDACGFIPASSGTGSFVVSGAVTGYQTPASANAVNATVYSYRAESADKSQWEEGFGAYTVSTTTLARSTITANSSGGTTAISFSAAPNVYITAATADLTNASLLTSGTLPAARIAFAAKTDQQAASSTTLPVAPAHMQDHDGVAKATGFITFSGTTPTLAAGYNVASVTFSSNTTTVNLTTAFASANYVVIAVGQIASSSSNVSTDVTLVTASQFTIVHREGAPPLGLTPTQLHFVCYGRQ